MPTEMNPPAAPPQRARLSDNLMEVAGVLCIAGFFWFVWPPAPLAVLGAWLFLGGNMRAARSRPGGRPRWSERVARAAAAYLAYRSGP